MVALFTGGTTVPGSALSETTSSQPASISDYIITEHPVRDGSPVAGGAGATTGWAWGEDSPKSIRVIVSRASGEQLGTALVTPAEESTLLRRTRLSPQTFDRCVVVSDVSIVPSAPSDTLASLLYFCGRRGRLWGRAMVVAALAKDVATQAGAVIALEPLSKLKSFDAGGQTWVMHAQRLDVAIHHAWGASSSAMQASLREHFVPEAVEMLETWIPTLFSNPWFRAVQDGTLTKEQYIYTLGNLHQFVRWTTRLIGRAVSHSTDRRLRNKWVEHLRGEVDHELIIERDLAALGADVEYVVSSMVPSVETQQFMVSQESMIGFHADPVRFEAPPFVAEGYAAHLDQKFIDALRSTARGWGIENPKQVTAFYASHIDFDGGYDGHWELGRNMLKEHLKTDGDLVRFLNVARLCMDSVNRSYTAYVDDLRIYSATSPGDAPR